MDHLPKPKWNKYIGVEGNNIILTFTKKELLLKVKEFQFSDKATLGRIGSIGLANIYELLSGDDKVIQQHIQKYIGFVPWNYLDILEQGISHPIFLPMRGCFGFINDNLILANRHHMEIMYRLMQDKGWTWEDLMEAEQVWGWYGRQHGSKDGSITFSSDAGLMTGKKTKEKCKIAFEELFKTSFKIHEGYGGKSKATFGGNMEKKYGKPGEWGGPKAEWADKSSTIMSPLPDPPNKIFDSIIPGNGNPPPQNKF